MSYYTIVQLTSDLVYIKWQRFAEDERYQEEQHIIDDLRVRFDNAPCPLYVLSDLRGGRITEVSRLKQLAALTRHPNFGGSAAFAKDPLSTIFAGVFHQLTRRDQQNPEIYEQPEEAIAFLESLKPGLTTTVDWAAVLR
ncbi:MAG: hypothetical protein IT324_17285 [Anaerolineae bacterium]|nr:hypothetical protein [Anaerolineae bacterium]